MLPVSDPSEKAAVQLSGQESTQLSGQESTQLSGQESTQLSGQESTQLSGQRDRLSEMDDEFSLERNGRKRESLEGDWFYHQSFDMYA